MRKELKQKREQTKQNFAQNFQGWKEKLKEKYTQRFPKPKMDKPTENLLRTNPDGITIESTKTTRLILKFWLIGLATVVL